MVRNVDCVRLIYGDTMKEQQYVVGGAVRDVLLGFNPKDIDYVWVNSSHDKLIAKGFQQVGSSFPVYLDCAGDEHALARQERKTAAGGYYGFECTVDSITIDQDLQRRDLTINSLAVRVEDWDTFVCSKNESLVIDPYGGIIDLDRKTLRHTSDAFVEDVIRLLRTARFAARYGFDVDKSTIELMRSIVPELAHVPQERIWVEFEKGLMEPNPYPMLQVLSECGALAEDGPLGIYSHCTPLGDEFPRHADLTTRAVLVLAKDYADHVYEHHRIPSDIVRVNRSFHCNRDTIQNWSRCSPEFRIRCFEFMRAFSDIELLNKVVKVAVQWFGVTGFDLKQLNEDLKKARSVDAAAIAADCINKSDIKNRIFEARVAALK